MLSSLTTILGFGALTFADNVALQALGYYAVAGELARFFTALLVMPALSHESKAESMLPKRSRPARGEVSSRLRPPS